MDEVRLALAQLIDRAKRAESVAWRVQTKEELSKWLDEDFLARDPQVPLADLYVLIDGL